MSLAPTSVPFKDSMGMPHDRLMMEDAAGKLSAVMVENPEQRAALISALETREDGNDATQGAKADAAWDGAAGQASIVSILKAIWGKLAGTLTVTGPLTNTQLRAAPVTVSGPLTDEQLRAAAVPVSGPLTEAQLRNSPLAVYGPAPSAPANAAIANGAALSAAIDLGNDRLHRVSVPAGWTAASISFMASTDNAAWFDLFDGAGEVILSAAVTSTGGRSILVDPAVFFGIRYLKIRSGTSSAPVNQAAARAIELVTVPR